MKRFDRITPSVAAALLACLTLYPCRAQTQPPSAPAAAELTKPAEPPQLTLLPAMTPDGKPLELQAPPLESTDQSLPINLATALRLADARPLIVGAAQASTWVAEAQLQRAKVLWLPQLNLGVDYI